MIFKEKAKGSEGPACPECGHTLSRVEQSRSRGGDDYKRRRRCCDCGVKFTTYETLKKSA